MFNLTENDFNDDKMYLNKCHSCGTMFSGHKRRPHCKVCHDKGTTNFEALSLKQQEAISAIMNSQTTEG